MDFAIHQEFPNQRVGWGGEAGGEEIFNAHKRNMVTYILHLSEDNGCLAAQLLLAQAKLCVCHPSIKAACAYTTHLKRTPSDEVSQVLIVAVQSKMFTPAFQWISVSLMS